MRHLNPFLLALLSLSFAASAMTAPVTIGFDLSGALVPVSAILPGGPPRDGIPAIDRPTFTPARAADELKADDRVLGVHLNVRPRPIRSAS
jgi:hypothetical protein